MNLIDIVNNLKKIALTQPNINSAFEGDVYEVLNSNPSVKYGVFHITQTSHNEQDNWVKYGFNLFIIDRLLSDNSNKVAIQSHATNILSNIIKVFSEEFDAEFESINYQPFTQKFKDNCCGVYCSVIFEVQRDFGCAEWIGDSIFKDKIVIINNKDVEFTENGVYEVPNGYSGYGTVKVNIDYKAIEDKAFQEGHVEGETKGYNDGYVEGVDNQKSKLEHITITDNGSYNKEDGYNSILVTLPLEEIREESFNEGYNSGISDAEDIIGNRAQVLSIRQNGRYSTRYSEEDANDEELIKEVLVDVRPKVKIPNGISFEGSTFNYFPVNDYDWLDVYSTNSMFKNCKNLDITNILQAMNDGIIDSKDTRGMFYGCDSVTRIENLDLTKYPLHADMFYDCINLEEVINYKLPYYKIDNSNRYSYFTSSVLGLSNAPKGKYRAYKNVDASEIDMVDGNVINFMIPFCYFISFSKMPKDMSYNNLPQCNAQTIIVTNGDKPQSLNALSSYQMVFYTPNSQGWESIEKAYPYLYYKELNNNKNLEIKIKNNELDKEQIVPYNEEKGCYYLDYPNFYPKNTYINDVLFVSNEINFDFYSGVENVELNKLYEDREVFNLYRGKKIDCLYLENNLLHVDTSLFDNNLNVNGFDLLTPTNWTKCYITITNFVVTPDTSNGYYSSITINGSFKSVIETNETTTIIGDNKGDNKLNIKTTVTNYTYKYIIKSIKFE